MVKGFQTHQTADVSHHCPAQRVQIELLSDGCCQYIPRSVALSSPGHASMKGRRRQDRTPWCSQILSYYRQIPSHNTSGPGGIDKRVSTSIAFNTICTRSQQAMCNRTGQQAMCNRTGTTSHVHHVRTTNHVHQDTTSHVR